MKKEGTGTQVVQAEFDLLIELLFRESGAYCLALKLYAGRYEVIVGKPAEDILREILGKHMPESAVSEDKEINDQADE